jgi:exo-beta-1,3-glucanase (GH17 family)
MTNSLLSPLRRALAAAGAIALLSLATACGGGGTVPSGGVTVRALPADYSTRHAAAYSPFRSANRDTETITPAMIKQDLDLLVQGNFRLIRLFDSSDNVTRATLQVIKDNGLDIKVHLGIYVLSGNESFNQAEIARGIALANEFADLVEVVSVGNETMVSWSFNKIAPSQMATYLAQVRDGVKQPVTTDDNWAFFASAPDVVLKNIDFVSLHSYALLDSVSAPGSWDWQQTAVAADQRAAAMMAAAMAKTQADYAAARTYLDGIGYTFLPITIGETGWKAVATGGESSRAHPVNQKMFFDGLNAWVAAGTGPKTVFWFEAFDEPWKGGDDGWGLFDVTRQARWVVQPLYPSSIWAPGTYTLADALYYVPPVSHPPVTASRYSLYEELTHAGEALPAETPLWNAWQNGTASVATELTGASAEGTKNMQITPTPLSWGWGMTMNFTSSSDDLSAFVSGGMLNFSVKTTYPGKIEVGFLTGTAADSSLYDVYIPIQSGDYGYVNDGAWHEVHIPIAAITPYGAMAFGETDPTQSKLDMTTVTNPFVIADRYAKTGKADNSGITTPIQVDDIYWSK